MKTLESLTMEELRVLKSHVEANGEKYIAITSEMSSRAKALHDSVWEEDEVLVMVDGCGARCPYEKEGDD